jgi:hypothetical protein
MTNTRPPTTSCRNEFRNLRKSPLFATTALRGHGADHALLRQSMHKPVSRVRMSTALRGHGGESFPGRTPRSQATTPAETEWVRDEHHIVRRTRPRPVLGASAQAAPDRWQFTESTLAELRGGFDAVSRVQPHVHAKPWTCHPADEIGCVLFRFRAEWHTGCARRPGLADQDERCLPMA